MDVNNKEVKAKKVSLITQIIATVWTVFWFTMKFVGIFESLESINVKEIGFSGLIILSINTPVYLNMIVDKLFGKENSLKRVGK